ncbi:MAG: hypothetical protein E7289_06330 [Lachnospiraceae bacterium]|nr:hypothetical protein [Lachnospiraceae bacterium]
MKRFTEIHINAAEGQKVFRHETEAFILVRENEEYCVKEQAEKMLAETGAKVLLLIGKISDRFLVRCLCKTEQTRALELIDFVFGQFGIAKGTAEWAQGSVSEVLLSVCMSEADVSDETEYFMLRADAYFTDCEVVEAVVFAEENPGRIREMKEYEKAHVSWAYVKTTEIVPEGVTLSVRTLENDTGVLVNARDDVYVMIGCLGEVYQIHRDKFESSYETSEEKLDIFTQMLDFIPAVERVDDHTYLPIDELAHLCYPKPGAGIYAQQLEKRTRVFSKNGSDYFVGEQGDYLAIRKDDVQDVYIIREEVFGRTYVEKEADE